MIRETIIRNVKAYNNTLTDEFFEGKTNLELLPLTHPVDRGQYANAVLKEMGYS